MCRGTAQWAQPQEQQRQHPYLAGGTSVRAPTSALERCFRSRGVQEAWDLLEVYLQNDGSSATGGDQGLVPADKYTVSQMLSKTISDQRNKEDILRGTSLAQSFIDSYPSDVDEGLFNSLLDACCQLKNVELLEEVKDKMLKLEVEPSAVTLGILVKTYGRLGRLDRVVAIWHEMSPQRKQANAVTYGCMIDACVKCGNLMKAFEVFEDAKKEGKHRSTVLYTTLIKGCSIHKDLQSAVALFREMKEEAVAYNTFTYNSIIDVCINCGAMHVAEGIFKQMIFDEGEVQACSPDLITFSTLLKGYCHACELHKAFMVIEAIRERGLPCDELVYNTLIDGCVKIGDLETGVGFFSEMVQSGAAPSPITHSILIKLYKAAGYAQQSSEAVAVLYQHYGFHPPLVNMRRRGCGRQNRNRGASPHSMLIYSKADQKPAHRLGTTCSQASSTESVPSQGFTYPPPMQIRGSAQTSPTESFPSHGLSHSTPMPFPASQLATMSFRDLAMPGTLVQGATSGTNSTIVDCVAQGAVPVEVQSMIQNMPNSMRSGPLFIMGPYPTPVSNVCAPGQASNVCASAPAKDVGAPASTEHGCSKPQTKAIFKI